MKKVQFVLFLLLVAFINTTYAQTVTVARLKNGGIFLESQNRPISNYYLNSTAYNTLVQSMKKAIEWHDLNQTHKANFEKEINRFKALEKQTYEFHGYVSQFTVNANVVFRGYTDGSSVVTLLIGHEVLEFVILTSRKDIQKFLDILQGKSANPEIDNIFKN